MLVITNSNGTMSLGIEEYNSPAKITTGGSHGNANNVGMANNTNGDILALTTGREGTIPMGDTTGGLPENLG